MEGFVCDSQNRKAIGALVILRGTATERGSGAIPLRMETRTDLQGRFRLAPAFPPPYDLEIQLAGFGIARRRVGARGSILPVVLTPMRDIQGIVRDGDGIPVRHAAVVPSGMQVCTPIPNAAGGDTSFTTDEEGRFRLTPTSSTTTLRIVAKGYESVTLEGVRPGVNLTIELRRSGWISGRVTDAKAQLLSGATIRIWPQLPRPDVRCETTADPAGMFELVGLPPGDYVLMASGTGLGLALLADVRVGTSGPTPIRVVLSPTGTISGRLVDDRRNPVQGTIEPRSWSGHDLPDRIARLLASRAASDGRFSLACAGAGPWTIAFSAEAFLPSRMEVSVAAAKRATVGDVILRRGRTISGTVLTTANVPLADVLVEAAPVNVTLGSPTGRGRTSSDGTYVLGGLGPGVYTIAARAPHLTGRPVLVYGDGPADIVLTAAGSIAGTAMDDAKRPLRSFRVSAVPTTAAGESAPSSIDVEATNGRFLLQDLTEGTYELAVTAPDLVPVRRAPVTVTPDRTTDLGVVTLYPGKELRGTVVDERGAPVSGATVLLRLGRGRTRDSSDLATASETSTDEFGRFVLQGATPGDGLVEAQHPEYAPTSLRVGVEAEQEVPEVELVLTRGGRLEGLAHRRDGTALVGFSVAVTPNGSVRRTVTTTTSDGSFAFDRVPAGLALVVLSSAERRGIQTSAISQAVDIVDGETTRLELQSNEVEVSGHVLRSGQPLQGVEVRLWAVEGTTVSMDAGLLERGRADAQPAIARMHAVTDSNGQFSLLVEDAGRYAVQLQSVETLVSYPPQILDVPPGGAAGIEIVVQAVSVSGRVIDADSGDGVGGASVIAFLIAPSPTRAAVEADADGYFSLVLDQGEYDVSVHRDGHLDAHTRIGVREGGPPLRVLLRRAPRAP